MSMFSFGDHDPKEKKLKNRGAATKMNYVLVFICAIIFAFVGLRFFTGDLFSSAKWWDSLNLQTENAFLDQPIPWEGFDGVTTTGVIFSLGLSVFQIIAGYQQLIAGGWTKKSEGLIVWSYNRYYGKDMSPINQEKLKWMLLWLAVVIVDTVVDISWRSYGFQQSLAAAILTSIVVYNLGSEFAVVYGIKYVFVHFLDIILPSEGSRRDNRVRGNNRRSDNERLRDGKRGNQQRGRRDKATNQRNRDNRPDRRNQSKHSSRNQGRRPDQDRNRNQGRDRRRGDERPISEEEMRRRIQQQEYDN